LSRKYPAWLASVKTAGEKSGGKKKKRRGKAAEERRIPGAGQNESLRGRKMKVRGGGASFGERKTGSQYRMSPKNGETARRRKGKEVKGDTKKPSRRRARAFQEGQKKVFSFKPPVGLAAKALPRLRGEDTKKAMERLVVGTPLP